MKRHYHLLAAITLFLPSPILAQDCTQETLPLSRNAESLKNEISRLKRMVEEERTWRKEADAKAFMDGLALMRAQDVISNERAKNAVMALKLAMPIPPPASVAPVQQITCPKPKIPFKQAVVRKKKKAKKVIKETFWELVSIGSYLGDK
jgi:hypothetical protein